MLSEAQEGGGDGGGGSTPAWLIACSDGSGAERCRCVREEVRGKKREHTLTWRSHRRIGIRSYMSVRACARVGAARSVHRAAAERKKVRGDSLTGGERPPPSPPLLSFLTRWNHCACERVCPRVRVGCQCRPTLDVQCLDAGLAVHHHHMTLVRTTTARQGWEGGGG